MKINRLIEILQEAAEEHGDLPLFVKTRYYDAGGGRGLSDTGGGWSTRFLGSPNDARVNVSDINKKTLDLWL